MSCSVHKHPPEQRCGAKFFPSRCKMMDNETSTISVDRWSNRMIAVVTDNLEAIRALCRKYEVRSLDLFGSAATGAFKSESSDIDFVVDLGEYTPGTDFRYLDLIEELELLLSVPVQMTTVPSFKHDYFRTDIPAERANVYDARSRKQAA